MSALPTHCSNQSTERDPIRGGSRLVMADRKAIGQAQGQREVTQRTRSEGKMGSHKRSSQQEFREEANEVTSQRRICFLKARSAPADRDEAAHDAALTSV